MVKLKPDHEETLKILYNLILNPATREWERSILLSAKNTLEDGRSLESHLSEIEADLRPLALRSNLTPDIMDFYNRITGSTSAYTQFDFSKHTIDDLDHQESAIFAGGCFWCMVEPFETRNGIISVLSGYTGGSTDHPTYDQVIGHYTGHVEAVEILFDKRIIQYTELVDLYWQLTDPTDAFGQFLDRGDQYRPIIYIQTEEQRQIAETSKQLLADSGKYPHPIVTEIKPADVFWPAENYHQQFYKKNPKRYKRLEQSRRQYLVFQHIKGKIHTELDRFKDTLK